MRARAVAIIGAFAVLSWASPGLAEPQGNAALTAGIAGRGTGGSTWDETRFHLGARGDVLFGRSQNKDFGLGPYAEVLTAFDDVAAGAGMSALVPVHGYLPIVLSGGGYAWNGPDGGWEPGLSAQLFWGSRSYNFHGQYIMAGGLTLQGRWGLGDQEERTIIIAAHLDGQVLALPLLLLVEAIGGPPSE